MSLKTYPEYKDSGVDWLGDVPAHWHIAPLGQHFMLRSETVSDKDFAPLSVTMSGVVPQMENVAKTENGDSRKLVRRGDFVINSRSDRKGSSGLADRDGSVSLISIVLIPRDIAPRFTHHLLRSVPFQEEFYRFGTGIVADLWSTRFSSMKAIRLALPTLSEQVAVAEYLDRELAEIDTFIGDQNELITLLGERRSATISQAVTKGLIPDAPMKDSGVEWLGRIPEHWTAPPLRHLISTPLKYGANEPADSADPADVRYLRITDFDMLGRLRDETFRSLPPEVALAYMVSPGDVLLARSGATVGKAFIVPDDAPPSCFAGYLIRANVSRARVLPEYFFAYTQSAVFEVWKNLVMVKATIQNIGADKYATLPVPVPPLAEQHKICRYLDIEIHEIDAAIAEAQEAIALSKERRAAVISAAVTGKIDVRGTLAPATNQVEAEPVGVA